MERIKIPHKCKKCGKQLYFEDSKYFRGEYYCNKKCQPLKQEKIKFISVADIRWNFYESMENGSRESMADYFESLYHHYQNRGKNIQKLKNGKK